MPIHQPRPSDAGGAGAARTSAIEALMTKKRRCAYFMIAQFRRAENSLTIKEAFAMMRVAHDDLKRYRDVLFDLRYTLLMHYVCRHSAQDADKSDSAHDPML